MNEVIEDSVQVTDQWLQYGPRRLFARRWKVQAPSQLAPIVMLHDSLGCVELWRDLPARLAIATGREVIAYDRLGFGRSDPGEALPALTFVADEAREVLPHVLAQLQLSRFVLLGHSVGGAMAIEGAARFSAGCTALVTIASQVYAEDRTLEGIRAARENFKIPAQVERLARYHGTKARWVLDAWIENWLDPGFAKWSIVDVLPAVSAPALALHGDTDEYGTIDHARRIGTGVREGTTRILTGFGHVPHRDSPAVVVEAICGFLRRAA